MFPATRDVTFACQHGTLPNMALVTVKNESRRTTHRDKDHRDSIFKRYDEVVLLELNWDDVLPENVYITASAWNASGPTLSNPSYDVLTKATTTLTAVAAELLAQGNAFYLTDTDGVQYTFVFDFANQVAQTTYQRTVDVNNESAIDVAGLITAAINESSIKITATDNGDGTVSLEQDVAGTVGNKDTSEAVIDAGFLLPNFSGGTGDLSDIKTYVTVGPGVGTIENTVTLSNGETRQKEIRYRQTDSGDVDETSDYPLY